MKKGIIYRLFIYFLSISFLLMMNGFPRMAAEAKEKNLPLGEMVSKGEVKFEAKENVWKQVEASHFPVFQGMKIKTEKGVAIISLSDNSQIEVDQNSLFSFDQSDRIHLVQGRIDFRIQSNTGMSFRVGNVSIIKSPPLQAAKGSLLVSPKNEETIGSISIHSNGSVTVKTIQGSLSILDQDRVVLAGLSSKDSVTLPSVTVKSNPKVMVAQAGDAKGGTGSETGEILGLSKWTWAGITLAAAAVVGVFAAAGTGGGDSDRGAVCPP